MSGAPAWSSARRHRPSRPPTCSPMNRSPSCCRREAGCGRRRDTTLIHARSPTRPPMPVPQPPALVAALSSEGRLLVFPVAEVPELPRGKGNKLFGIPAKRSQAREELMSAVAVLGAGQALRVYSGERQMTLNPADLEHYRGERAQRGAVLPRGWRTVERIEAVAP